MQARKQLGQPDRTRTGPVAESPLEGLFEQLSPSETARVLGIKEEAAGMRYVRALRRLKEILSTLEGDWLDP